MVDIEHMNPMYDDLAIAGKVVYRQPAIDCKLNAISYCRDRYLGRLDAHVVNAGVRLVA